MSQLTITISLSSLHAAAPNRPAGYVEEVLSMAESVNDTHYVISFDRYVELWKQFRTEPPPTPPAWPAYQPISPHWGTAVWAYIHTEADLTLAKLMDRIRRIPPDCDCRSNSDSYIEQHPPGDGVIPHQWRREFHNNASQHAGHEPFTAEQYNQRWAIGIEHPRRGLLVGNWFGDDLRPNARQSMRAAALRWGAEFVEMTTPIDDADDRDAYAQKLRLDLHAAGFDQVICLDRDAVIRSDCPSLFDQVPLRSFGAVPSEQPGHERHADVMAHLSPLFARAGQSFDLATDHFNGGLYIFSPAVHGSIFQDARRMAAMEADRHWTVYEEGLISLAACRSGISLIRLDNNFNRCGGPSREQWQPKMQTMIQHYCGDAQGRNARIDQTIWQL